MQFTEIDIAQDAGVLLEKHFDGLHSGGGVSSIKGGQTAADNAAELREV
jgi:hypothetical protein